MARHPHLPVRTRWVAIMPLVLAGAFLAGCGGSSSTSATSPSSSPSTAVPSTAASGGSSSQLKSFGGTIEAAKSATFKATYTSTTSGGTTQTVTLAQAPPKQLFSTTDSSGNVSTLLNTGTATYSCDTSPGGTPTCTPLGSTGMASALSAVIGVHNGSAALTAINSWQSIVGAHLSGASLTFTDPTIAGQPVRCANWSYQGSSATYCVTSGGVLAKVRASGGSGSSAASSNFELTSLTTSPPASDFEVPAGATVVTIPSGA